MTLYFLNRKIRRRFLQRVSQFLKKALAATLSADDPDGRLPINLISEIAVPISLSLRLFANVLSGTVMMALIYGLLGVIATAWPAALHVYFDLFSGAIQTYVFCMLTMTYIANARGDA